MPALPRLDDLTLEQMVGQLVFARIGSNLPPIIKVSDDEQRVAALLNESPLGGLLLFNGDWPATRQTLDRLQELASVPLLVGADLERGAGQQVAGLTVFPHAAAFGRLGDEAESAVFEAAAATAEEARAAGVAMVFGPVADVNTNPKNPIIATRAFADSPAQAATLAAAAVRGVQATGALAVAKHFPGHGDTTQDSHAEVPRVDKPADKLRNAELLPFAAAVAAGVSTIMTAHVSYPALDPSGTPASFSAPILQDVLRKQLGFDGAVCTDSLLMEGARAGFGSEGEMAAAAIGAGVDILLDVAKPRATIDFLLSAVERGELAANRVKDAARRVLVLKERAGLGQPQGAQQQASPHPAPAKHAALAERVAASAIAANPRRSAEAALDASRPLCVVLLKPFQLATDPPRQPLAEAAERLAPACEYFELGPELDEATAEAALASARRCGQLLLAVIAKPAAWHAFGMSDSQRAFAKRLLAAAERPVVASLGVPTILEEFPAGVPPLCSYSDAPVSQAAIAAKVLGAPT